MMLGVIFSKDRALQLDACIASCFRHTRGSGQLRMQVLYDASSPRHLKQYAELARSWSGKVAFLHEVRFRDSLLGILRDADKADRVRYGTPNRRRGLPEAMLGGAPESHVLFLVDDTIFVRDFPAGACQSTLQAHPEVLGISLRLGKNTIRSYAMSRRQALPPFANAESGLLLYDWETADGDFGYPLELSSSVYRMEDLLPVLNRIKFGNPNTLESGLSLQAQRFARTRPSMLCPEQSIAFSTPINRVQTVFENRSGHDPQWSVAKLADRFEEGLRVDVARLDGFTPSACHQEMELPLEVGA